jgi:AcrR family transcriptional regulator
MANLRTAQKMMTRKLLLESALALFQARGYIATTIDEIASGAGATRTTFYLHFASKVELMDALIDDISDTVGASDVPTLPQVVASGDPEQVRAWITRRFDQWPVIMPYVNVVSQATGIEPGVLEHFERWLDTPVREIVEGLDLANRFDSESRRPRAVLAFGEVEFLSRRWSVTGWTPEFPRAVTLDLLTENWCTLLIGAIR